MHAHRAQVLLVLALACVLAAPARAADVVPVSRAIDHVGERVTLEGRVFAVHTSPTAAVLAFAPNFAGFTATILAADLDKFPGDLENRYRGKVVQLAGTVTAYRGKPEMRLQDPTQVVVVVTPGESPTPRPSPSTPPSPAVDAVTRQTLGAVLERLDAIEARLAAIERALAGLAAAAPAVPASGLAVGATGASVRAVLGDPIDVTRGTRGETLWVYNGGRTVAFDAAGRVVSWSGF